MMVGEETVRRGSVSTEPLTVLLADDEDTVRRVMEQMLTRLGHRVIAAADGSQAMTRFIERFDEIDLVIFDMTMPEMDGAQLFTNIKHIKPDIKALLITGGDNTPEIDEMMQHGLSGVLHKPFSMQNIQHALGQVVGAAGLAVQS